MMFSACKNCGNYPQQVFSHGEVLVYATVSCSCFCSSVQGWGSSKSEALKMAHDQWQGLNSRRYERVRHLYGITFTRQGKDYRLYFGDCLRCAFGGRCDDQTLKDLDLTCWDEMCYIEVNNG